MSKSFYSATTADEAGKEYVESTNTLYDTIKNQKIEEIILPVFKEKHVKSVLEVGPAGGLWTKKLLDQNVAVTTVDILPVILEANKKQNPRARFVLGDATEIKMKEQFDFIFAKDIIEHIKDDEKFLENMNSHLKDGGIMFLNTQNSLSLNYIIEGLGNYLAGNKKWCGWDPTHLRFYTYFSLRQKLHKAGFDIINTFGFYHVPYRYMSLKFLRRIHEHRIFHLVETTNLYNKMPFNIIGWNIGMLAVKKSEGNAS